MSGITDPTEEYFKDGLWGWVTDQWKKLIGDDAGHLQVDIVESGLPTGAATSANQATMITALQLIDDLRAALNSVATDELDVVIDGQTADVEVKQTTAADLTPGIMGWDGSAWRKLPLVWGYYDRWSENAADVASGGGHATAVTTAVPAGYIYILHVLSFFHNAGVAKTTAAWVSDGTVFVTLAPSASTASGVPREYHANIVLKAGDTISAYVSSPGDGKYVSLSVWGYKMKVAE